MRSVDKSNHYTPLPQALSDDEEDEAKYSTMRGGADPEGRSPNFINDENNMTSIPVKLTERKNMTCIRKFCLFASITIACLAVMSFLWVLPCDVGYAPCLSQRPYKSDSNWQIIMPSTGFSSGLQLVDADQDGRMDIILVFHKVTSSNIFSEESSSFTSGVIVLRGYDGKKLWQQTYYDTPTDILCNILDVNKDGVKDCILIGNLGLFSAINISNDHTFWYLHDHMKARRPVDLSIPAIVPDLTGDGVEDLVILCHLGDDTSSHVLSPVSYMIVISGNMGELWGEPLAMPNCTSVSAPVSVLINGTTHLFVHCEPDDESGAVLMITLDQLKDEIWSNASLANTTGGELKMLNHSKLLTTVHRFKGQGSHLHLLVEDLNSDDMDDIMMIGGDGEVAVYHSTNFSMMWSYQKKGFDILGCIQGPILEYRYKTVLLTMLPQNCSDECSTIIIGLLGVNGSEIWIYSEKSVTSPVVVPKSEAWQNLVAFKAFTKYISEGQQVLLENLTVPISDLPFEQPSTESSAEDSSSKEEDENTSVISVTEKLLLLNAQYELQEQVLQQTANICYALTKHLPECLPAFAFHASSAVGDFDGDERADLISIMMSIDETSEHKTRNLHVTKTKLPPQVLEDNMDSSNIHVGHFRSFE